ncbi:MAG: glycosyltransferase family 2 protein [Pseudomonadota bacterium]
MAEYDKAVVFLCYKQELFVEAAVRSLLSQSVPVHAWLLDDASPDTTWQRVLACLSEPRCENDTSHKLEPCRAVVNGGLAKNWNRAIPHLTEEWIYVFEGDDVSNPERIDLCDRFIRAHPSLAVLSCRVMECSATGTREVPPRGMGGIFGAGSIKALDFPDMPGCSLAVRRDVFSVFGKLNRRLLTVDSILIRRGLMLGDAGLLDETLVSYRKHDSNVSRVFDLRYDSLKSFRHSMLSIQRHTLGSLHEFKKLWRYGLRNGGAGTARVILAKRIYLETRAHAALGLALASGSRRQLFMTAAANILSRKEYKVSQRALALAVWSRTWSVWGACKQRLRAVMNLLRGREKR